MKKTNLIISKFILALLMLMMIQKVNSQVQWQYVGNEGFSLGSVGGPSIAIDNQGIPYIVFQDNANNYKATVLKFNNNSWAPLGLYGFSSMIASWTNLAIDNSGTPYVVFNQSDSLGVYGATVMKFNGNSWVTIGNPNFTNSGVSQTQIAIDGNGTPYVVFINGSYSAPASVMKYDGNSWVPVGNINFTPGMAWYVKMALDTNGYPYVVFKDYSNNGGATVMKYDGNNWVIVGNAGFTQGLVNCTSIGIDGNNTPYVAYVDCLNGNRASVRKFDGNNWIPVGNIGFSVGSVNSTSIAISSNGDPYVVFNDSTNNNKVTLMKFYANLWQTLGNSGFTNSGTFTPSIALNTNNIPYIAFSDWADSLKLSVMKYDSILSCAAQFLLFPDTSTAHHYFILNNALGIPPIHYLWSWGDSTYDTIPYPSHIYADSGFYNICLTITDSIGCTSTYCDSSYHIMRTTNTMYWVNVISPNQSGIKEKFKSSGIIIFPNPTTNILNIHQSITSQNELVIITDILGHEVYKAPLTGIDNTIELMKWSNGVYFYEVKSEKESVRGKFIKQ
ncbi:MAG: T9SS type A sorting domain-containing protein [Bacteroidota bacterium]